MLFLMLSAYIITAPVSSGTSVMIIYGTIAPLCAVEVALPSALVDLDARGTQPVTAIVYHCNNVNGFRRQVTSLNEGALVWGGQRVTYSVSQDGESAIAIPPTILSSPFFTNVSSDAAITGTSGMLSVSVPDRPAQLLAGDYTDTITIEITPN